MLLDWVKEKYKDIKKNISRYRHYFRYAKGEIIAENFNVLSSVCIISMIVIALMIFITPMIMPTWQVSWHYIAFLGSMAILTACVILAKHSSNTTDIIKVILCRAYIVVMMIYLMMLDIVPYPKDASVFTGALLSIAPIIFILSAREILVIELAYIAVFAVATTRVKGVIIASGDIFSAIIGLIAGVVIYSIVISLRIKDFMQKTNYRISSETDALTGLSNRNAAEKNIENYLMAKDPNEACAMLVIDVDDFKNVNDTRGHAFGDEVLKGIAHILKREFRRDDICARFGGDEFIAFVKKIDNSHFLDEKCTEMNNAIKALYDTINISCSIGVAVLENGAATSGEIFSEADKALYEAKKSGKGTFVRHKHIGTTNLQNLKPLMLIIDDSRIDRSVLSAQFEDKFRVSGYADGETAVQFLKINAAHVTAIIIDIVMPQKSGIDIISEIKAIPEAANIAIIAISSDSGYETAALEAGADEMITKPIVPSVAKLRVDKAIKSAK